jgi:hypothetical protein
VSFEGVACRDLGANRFLFTFLQGSGKRRALEDGPWMFNKDLVIMAEFDGEKTIDEIKFSSIPIWVRIKKMSLGFVNKLAGQAIGAMIGDVLEVGGDADDTTIGQFLRVKIRLDIRKPLMRGVTVDLGDGVKEKTKWCPLFYEYLPNFYYTCGLIGHTDGTCEVRLEKGAMQQFGKHLRFIPEKKKVMEDYGCRVNNSKHSLPWRPSFMGKGSGGSISWGSGSGKGSDGLIWRKDDSGG